MLIIAPSPKNQDIDLIAAPGMPGERAGTAPPRAPKAT
jgi:hypothetical protein